MEDGDAPTLQQLAFWYGELKLVHKRLHDAYDAAQTENKRFKTSTSDVQMFLWESLEIL